MYARRVSLGATPRRVAARSRYLRGLGDMMCANTAPGTSTCAGLADGMLIQSVTAARVAGVGGFNAYLYKGGKRYMFPDGITANAYGASTPSRVMLIPDAIFNTIPTAGYVGSPNYATESGVPAPFDDAPSFAGVSNFLQTPQAIAQAVAAGVPIEVITAPQGTVVPAPSATPAATATTGILTAPAGPTPLGASAAAPATASSSNFGPIAILAALGAAAYLAFGS